jgi:hypothetical protein
MHEARSSPRRWPFPTWSKSERPGSTFVRHDSPAGEGDVLGSPAGGIVVGVRRWGSRYDPDFVTVTEVATFIPCFFS